MIVARGSIRDSIIDYLLAIGRDASVTEISDAITKQIGDVPPSSVRSYLRLNVPELFERTARGRYRLRGPGPTNGANETSSQTYQPAPFVYERSKLYRADCFEWLAAQEPASIHAVVTDPPYGLLEYTKTEQTKLRNGKGGVWRIPPSFDGHRRSPLPRFTVLTERDHEALYDFFRRLGILLARVTVPGANIIVASNPLFAHLVATAMSRAGLEIRGTIVRLVMTMRGGDRPKNAHDEFRNVSVLPRSMFEPWVVLRNPLDGRIQDNLRKWCTGGFRRLSDEKPFGDVIKSRPTSPMERKIAPHPSLKPQAFLRDLVRACLPLETGIILDPFAGSGSTLAAASAVGYESIGTELDEHYIRIATSAIPKLSKLSIQ